MSFFRALNFFKVLAAYVFSKYLKKPTQWGLPLAISIEPTTSCNLRCPECPSGLRSFTRPTGMLANNLFETIINQISKHTTYLTFYFQGEPFLNKDFLAMVKYAHTKSMYTLTSTNAHYITKDVATEIIESGLSKIIISLDGITQETYQQYRIGGILDKVINGTENLIAARKRLNSKYPIVEFQFLVVSHNEHQINDAKKLAKDMGADSIVFKTAQIYDYENGSKLMTVNEKYNRYTKTNNGKWDIKNKLENHCWKLWNSCVITWDGKIVPCCFDKDAKYEMGNLNTHSFASIWQNENYKIFRQKVLASRKNIDICSNCSEGSLIYG